MTSLEREAARRHPHGFQVRLGGHEERGRHARQVRRGVREPRPLGAPHAEGDHGVRDSSAAARGIEVLIAGAGGAAHLAGVAAAHTTLPVLGVPMESASLKGLDSLLSTVQMPGGIPVATFAIGKPGAVNAALFAVAVLAGKRADLRQTARRLPGRAGRQDSPGEADLADLDAPRAPSRRICSKMERSPSSGEGRQPHGLHGVLGRRTARGGPRGLEDGAMGARQGLPEGILRSPPRARPVRTGLGPGEFRSEPRAHA